MRPPLLNFVMGLLGALLIFVGMAVHPSLILIGVGLGTFSCGNAVAAGETAVEAKMTPLGWPQPAVTG